jgi:alanyl-tRNA synthetase
MTTRLYYDDPSLREFEATVLRCEPRGDGHAVWLDRSAFYPTTGGQPFDTGTLGSAAVEGVEEDDCGDVVHVVRSADRAALEPGATVSGAIDWPRRVDHMQQHTGQHLLSALFVRLYGVPTVSFHLGAGVSTFDLAREVTAAQIAKVEEEANLVVWENRPVSIRYATAAEAAAMPLRKESIRTGTLRLIDIEGVDLSACGGTHVARTGSIGTVVVNRWERFKGGQRIEFLCGGRTLSRFRALRDVVAAGTALLSVQPDDLPGAIERLQADVREQKRSLGALHTELARFQAEALARTAEPHAAGQLVLGSVNGDADALKSLATAIATRPGFIAVLVSEATPALVVAARAADVSVSCGDLVTQLTRQFGGRGGGRPTLAQAGGLNASAAEILAAAKRIIVA